MNEITHSATVMRAKDSAKDIFDNRHKQPSTTATLEAWEHYLEELESDCTYQEEASECVDSYDWVIYSNLAKQIVNMLTQAELDDVKERYKDIYGDEFEGLLELYSSYAFLYLEQQLQEELHVTMQARREYAQDRIQELIEAEGESED